MEQLNNFIFEKLHLRKNTNLSLDIENIADELYDFLHKEKRVYILDYVIQTFCDLNGEKNRIRLYMTPKNVKKYFGDTETFKTSLDNFLKSINVTNVNYDLLGEWCKVIIYES